MQIFKVNRVKKFKSEEQKSTNQDVEDENESENSLDLESFLIKFLSKHQRLQFLPNLKAQLEKMYVASVNDLVTLPPHYWETIQQNSNLGPFITPLLLKEIELKRTQLKRKEKKKKTPAEILGDIHKIKRFLFFETNLKNPRTNRALIDELPLLNSKALRDGFEEQKRSKKFDGGPVLDLIKVHLNNLTISDLPDMVKPSHGMILWGPPGTGIYLAYFLHIYKEILLFYKHIGKTCLCEIICKKAGIELVVEPLSSSELNRSKVGETEQILLSLFRRAEALPHLLCCIVS